MNFNSFLNKDINKLILSNITKDINIWIVGGTLRDFLLEKECFDTDYVITGVKAFEFAEKIAEKVDGHFVPLDKSFDIARVVMPDKKTTLDFAGALENDIIKDLERRDFSINAMAYSLKEAKYIDLFNGINDIKQGIIRVISEKNLIDDPLRILRAYRFAAQTGFNIDEKTLILIKKYQTLINNIAVERIKAELIKLFEGDFCAKTLTLMKETGFLFELFPELSLQTKVPPNLHHHLPLIDHSIEVVRQIELKINEMPDNVKEHLNEDICFGISRKAILKFAGLLHDLGKPATWLIDDEGRHRFIKHEDVGAELSLPILKKLTLNKNASKIIEKLIRYHLYPSQILKEENITEKSILRFYRKIETDVPELIILAMGDRLSARGIEISNEIVNKNISGLNMLLNKYYETSENIISIPKLLSGMDVMNILKIDKGPEVGKVLKALKEAQINGDVNNYDEAVKFIINLE